VAVWFHIFLASALDGGSTNSLTPRENAASSSWIGSWIVWFGIDPGFVGRSACICCYSGTQHRCLRLRNITHNETGRRNEQAGLVIMLWTYIRAVFVRIRTGTDNHNWGLPSFYSVPPVRCRNNACIELQPIPSKSFQVIVHPSHSSIQPRYWKRHLVTSQRK
jgi:hypothetical protein